MSRQSDKELREQVRDQFAGLTGTYDGADAMADLAIDLLHSHMQTAFEERLDTLQTYKLSGESTEKMVMLEDVKTLAAKWLGGDK